MCGSIGTDIGINLVHAYRIIIYIVEYCDFVGVRMVTFLFGIGVEWLERSMHICFGCEM